MHAGNNPRLELDSFVYVILCLFYYHLLHTNSSRSLIFICFERKGKRSRNTRKPLDDILPSIQWTKYPHHLHLPRHLVRPLISGDHNKVNNVMEALLSTSKHPPNPHPQKLWRRKTSTHRKQGFTWFSKLSTSTTALGIFLFFCLKNVRIEWLL